MKAIIRALVFVGTVSTVSAMPIDLSLYSQKDFSIQSITDNPFDQLIALQEKLYAAETLNAQNQVRLSRKDEDITELTEYLEEITQRYEIEIADLKAQREEYNQRFHAELISKYENLQQNYAALQDNNKWRGERIGKLQDDIEYRNDKIKKITKTLDSRGRRLKKVIEASKEDSGIIKSPGTYPARHETTFSGKTSWVYQERHVDSYEAYGVKSDETLSKFAIRHNHRPIFKTWMNDFSDRLYRSGYDDGWADGFKAGWDSAMNTIKSALDTK